jgi:hypothetical protein
MKEVIIKLLDYSKLNVKQFSEKLGMQRAQAIYDIVSGKTKRISEKLANQIISEFPEINKVWLLTGEGEMLKDSSAVSSDHSVSIAGNDIKENKINVNADKTIAMLVAEVAAQRRVTEKVLEQNSELLAMIAANNKR